MLLDTLHTGLVLVLHLALVLAQEDAGAVVGYVGQEKEQDDARPVEQLDVGCEEGLEYMRFLRNDISEHIDEILQKSIFKASERKGKNVLEETVAKALVQVMEVREIILMRIKKIRRGEVDTCANEGIHQDKRMEEMRLEAEDVLLKLVKKEAASISGLKDISLALLGWKKTVGDEVMRVMMLPEINLKEKFEIAKECEECRRLEEINFRVENLLTCVEKEEFTEENFASIFGRFGGEFDNEATEDVILVPGEFCDSSDKYASEVLIVIDIVDAELRLIYNKLIENRDEGKRIRYQDNLSFYTSMRITLEKVVRELMDVDKDEKMKTIVREGLADLSNDVVDVLKECMRKCGPLGCNSCAVEIINDIINKLKDYNQKYSDRENLQIARIFQKNDVIKLIEENNAIVRDVFEDKTKGSPVSNCDQDKLDVWDKLKNPLWMVVNTTIQADADTIILTNNAMKDLLEELMQEYCAAKERSANLPDDLNCELKEYEHTKEILEKIDDIQTILFKENSEKAKLDAMLGFVEIMKILDIRVRTLFEEEAVVTCPNEIKIIKSDYMPQVSICMVTFMNPKLKFSQISRMERMSCVKQLGTNLENRKLSLLRTEVERSLELIDRPTASPLSLYG